MNQSLRAIVEERGPLDYRATAEFVRSAAILLALFHEKGIIHCGITPDSLVVDSKGNVSVLDAGLSRSGADFLAPELAVAVRALDSRTDIYSLGCTLYYMLTSHPPFPQGALAQRIYMHQHKAPPSIYEDRPDAPRALVDLCERMMANSPYARPKTANGVAAELFDFLT